MLKSILVCDIVRRFTVTQDKGKRNKVLVAPLKLGPSQLASGDKVVSAVVCLFVLF